MNSKLPKWTNEGIFTESPFDEARLDRLKKALRIAWKVLSENCRCVEFGLNDFECPICIALLKIDKLGNRGKT